MLPPDAELSSPFFILDNGLNPLIADLMSQLEYPITSVKVELGDPPEGIKDPVIIDHIARKYGFRGVWLTKDSSSRKVHIEQIRASRISVVWIKQQKLSTIQQHRIITHIIPTVTQDLIESTHPIHFEVNFHGTPNRERITCLRKRQG